MKMNNNNPHHLVVGEGKISGIASVVLGVCSLLAVLCYLFPSYLTTTELRAAYDAVFLQKVLMYGMYTSLFFGMVTFIINKNKRLGAIGIMLTLVAYAAGGWEVPVGPVEPLPYSLGVDWMLLAFLVSAALFVFLEKIFPHRRDQAILRPDWGLDFAYFVFNHLLISVLLIVTNGFSEKLFGWAVHDGFQNFVQDMPIWLQVLGLMMAADFVLYWNHRMFHEVPWLWKFHAVHHSTEHLDWMSGSRSHLVYMVGERCLVMVPLYLLGASKEALDLYVAIAAFQAVYIHANMDVKLGWLNKLVVDARFHHWHHSSEKEAIDKNYCAHTPLFDWLFGTYHLPKDRWPQKYGTTSPLPKGFFKQLFYPLKK
jgi:sterol desaturase/sphingolipid hydroxylase (fatty acid hydroxylase superfamily)